MTLNEQLSTSAATTRSCRFVLPDIRTTCPSLYSLHLSCVQDSAARPDFNLPKFSHTAPLLHTLHWLPTAVAMVLQMAQAHPTVHCDLLPPIVLLLSQSDITTVCCPRGCYDTNARTTIPLQTENSSAQTVCSLLLMFSECSTANCDKDQRSLQQWKLLLGQLKDKHEQKLLQGELETTSLSANTGLHENNISGHDKPWKNLFFIDFH